METDKYIKTELAQNKIKNKNEGLPSKMAKVWINRTSNNLTINGTEFFNSVTKGNDLRWTNKCAKKKKKQTQKTNRCK